MWCMSVAKCLGFVQKKKLSKIMAIEKSTDVYLYKNGTSPTLRKS